MKKINYTITNIEGIHIGTAYNRYEKGGIDSYTIKDYEGYPYIPATSIKGKVRFFLDNLEMFEPSDNLMEEVKKNVILEAMQAEGMTLSDILFGKKDQEENGYLFNSMKKILFKDAKLMERTGKPEEMFEIKAENEIKIDCDNNKIESNPRIIERTIPGLKYQFEIIIVGFEGEDTIINLFDFVFECIQNYGYIGGSGSRGYGQVKIERGEK